MMVLNQFKLKLIEIKIFFRWMTKEKHNNFFLPQNLKFLSTSSKIYADGTFSHCTKFFKQLFTVHGHKNVHYVPPSSQFFKLFLDSVIMHFLTLYPNILLKSFYWKMRVFEMCHVSCAPTIFLYFNLRINKYNLPSNDFEENFVSRYYSLFRKLQTLQMIN
jgi:hypothetical protein